MTDPMQQARELSSPESIGFRLRNLAQNMAAGSEPVARDHQAWKRVEELAEAVAALRAAPEGFVMVPVEFVQERGQMYVCPTCHGPGVVTKEIHDTIRAAHPQEASDA